MNEWRKVKFLDYIELNPKVPLKKGVLYPFIEMANVDCYTRQPKKIGLESFSSGVKFQEDDTVIARIEPCLQNGKGFLFRGAPYGFGSTEFLVFRAIPEKTSPLFVYYLMQTYRIKNLMINSMSGATGRQRVNNDIFNNLEIELPPLATQHRIAEILSRYDSLIENYQRQIKLLEEAAHRLYKEWFVDLRFPGHESTPIINNLPKGWEKKKLGEVVKTTSGGTPSRGKPEYYTGNIPWVKTKELNDSFILDTEEKISVDAINNSSAKILPTGSVLLAMYGATIGKLGIASKELACNQACCVFLFNDNDVFRWFLYNWLIINRSFLISQGKGATQPNLSQDMIKNFEAIVPDTPLLEKYNRMVTPLYEIILNHQAQIRNLTEARDRLLPKLMNGDIEV